MVTKLQQLKWLAKRFDSLPFGSDSIVMSDEVLGYLGHEHKITNQELKQERDKMSSKPEVDNSWYERGELPPVGCECRFFSDGYDENWFDWCIFHGLATCGGLIVEHHHKTSPSRVTVCLFNPRTTKFRPLCTKREKEIDEMGATLRNRGSAISDVILGELYDAGFRMVNP